MHNMQKTTEMHDQRPLEIKEKPLVSFTVYSNPFIRAMSKILISASVSVYHFISYGNSQKDLKWTSKGSEDLIVRFRVLSDFYVRLICECITILKITKKYKKYFSFF